LYKNIIGLKMSRILIDLPETIETERLILQIPKAGFGKKLHEAVTDGYEDYIKWLNWPIDPPTLQACEEECRKHHAEFILRDLICYLIIDKKTDNVIGKCSFPTLQANWLISKFGIGYFIRKSERGNRYATETAHAMALLAFRELKAKKIEIYCDAENIASTKVPLNLGFKLEYTSKGGWPRQDGKLGEIQTYSIFSEEDMIKR
jgi:ribosomal-protein-serine acetyltransferase